MKSKDFCTTLIIWRTKSMKAWIKADNGKRYKVLEYDNGQRVEIPINQDGTVKWLEEPVKQKVEVR